MVKEKIHKNDHYNFTVLTGGNTPIIRYMKRYLNTPILGCKYMIYKVFTMYYVTVLTHLLTHYCVTVLTPIYRRLPNTVKMNSHV